MSRDIIRIQRIVRASTDLLQYTLPGLPVDNSWWNVNGANFPSCNPLEFALLEFALFFSFVCLPKLPPPPPPNGFLSAFWWGVSKFALLSIQAPSTEKTPYSYPSPFEIGPFLFFETCNHFSLAGLWPKPLVRPKSASAGHGDARGRESQRLHLALKRIRGSLGVAHARRLIDPPKAWLRFGTPQPCVSRRSGRNKIGGGSFGWPHLESV